MSKLLQLKVPLELKGDLDFIADYKGITVAALIKMDLKDLVRKEKRQIFTANGLTADEELEVSKRDQEAMADYKEGKLSAKSGKEILKELNA